MGYWHGWKKKRKTKPNIVKESTTNPISVKKKIVTVNKTEKSQAPNKNVYTPKSNKTDKGISIDNSRSTQKIDTENTFDKSRSIPWTNLPNKGTII